MLYNNTKNNSIIIIKLCFPALPTSQPYPIPEPPSKQNPPKVKP